MRIFALIFSVFSLVVSLLAYNITNNQHDSFTTKPIPSSFTIPFGLSRSTTKTYQTISFPLTVTRDSIPATKYKSGFTYYDDHGVKTTLIKWENVSQAYYENRIKVYPALWRWSTKLEFAGVVIKGKTWTDDCWIDVYTGKAYLDEKKHQVVYYNK